MSRIDADIAALTAFHLALGRFEQEQRGILDKAAHELDATRASLERKTERWRMELARRESALAGCQRQAAAAAQRGMWSDCSRELWAVQEAEERLANVRGWSAQVEQEAAVYLGTASRYRSYLDGGARNSANQLHNVIEALKAARSTTVTDS